MRLSCASIALLGAVSSLMVSNANAQLISELEPDPPSFDPDTAKVELSGTPGAAFSGWIIFFESDPATDAGEVNNQYAAAGTFDSLGLLVVDVGNFENPAFTAVLTQNAAPANTDIDTNNDGTIDVDLSFLGTIYDAIGVQKSTTQIPLLYGTQLNGTNFARIQPGSTSPKSIFREASVGAWYGVTDSANPSLRDINNTPVALSFFDPSPDPLLPTYGAINPTKAKDTVKKPPCNPSVCQACFYYCGVPPYNYMCEALGEHATGKSCEVDPWCAFCARVCPKEASSNDECPGGCLTDPDDYDCLAPARKLGFLSGITSS